MTPKDTLIKALEERFGFSEYKARQVVEDQFDVLKSAGLFIGPVVATEGMVEAVKPFPAHLVSADLSDPKHVAMRAATLADQLSVKTLWRDLVTEWQRGGGT